VARASGLIISHTVTVAGGFGQQWQQQQQQVLVLQIMASSCTCYDFMCHRASVITLGVYGSTITMQVGRPFDFTFMGMGYHGCRQSIWKPFLMQAQALGLSSQCVREGDSILFDPAGGKWQWLCGGGGGAGGG